MTNDPIPARTNDVFWSSRVVYGMATACLVLGLAAGYLLRGSESRGVAPSPTGQANTPPNGNAAEMPTLEQMKQMADKKVEPLLTQLKKDPKNKDVLLQTAYFYKSAHQFKDAVAYFDRVLEIDPKNVSVRTEKASCLYYSGDVDGALAELQQSLKINPKDANSLFNLGVVRWKGRQDAAGAVAAWRELLKSNPHHEKKAVVEQLIAEAQQSSQAGSSTAFKP